MKKVLVVLAAMAAVLAMALPSPAFTRIASCSGSTGIQGCSTTFVALSNLETTHVRVIPAVTFEGSVQTQIFEVGNPANEVHYDSIWVTGRIQLDGPTYSGPYQLLAGHTYTLVAHTSPTFGVVISSGSLTAVLEV